MSKGKEKKNEGVVAQQAQQDNSWKNTSSWLPDQKADMVGTNTGHNMYSIQCLLDVDSRVDKRGNTRTNQGHLITGGPLGLYRLDGGSSQT